ncbi:MAG: hypothetical protein ABIR03_06505 [Ginsengibacter sp.]
MRELSDSGKRITLLFAHRLFTFMHADRIYVSEKGKIYERASINNYWNTKVCIMPCGSNR